MCEIFEPNLVLEFRYIILQCLQRYTMATVRVEWANGEVNHDCCPETNTIIRHLPSTPSFRDCELADMPHQPEEQHVHACWDEIRSIQCSCGVNDTQAFFRISEIIHVRVNNPEILNQLVQSSKLLNLFFLAEEFNHHVHKVRKKLMKKIAQDS